MLFMSHYYRPGTVLFSLTAAVVSIEIGFNENGIQLNAFQV